MSYPWSEARLAAAVEDADECGCGCASALVVESLVEEVRRLSSQLRIATQTLEYIAGDSVRGPARFPVTTAHDALIQMSVAEDDARR